MVPNPASFSMQNQGGTMSEESMPTEAELQFYYFGLYAVLRRYRMMTILGWVIILLGLASIPLSWRLGTPHGLVDTLLSLGTAFAGLALVQANVALLTSYLQVPFGHRPDGTEAAHPAVRQIEELIRDIDEGGWQEAYAAIGKLERMQEPYGLPPPAGS